LNNPVKVVDTSPDNATRILILKDIKYIYIKTFNSNIYMKTFKS